MAEFEHMNTERVFYHFEEICSIPRGSGNMEKISSYCVEFAKNIILGIIPTAVGMLSFIKTVQRGMKILCQ